MKTAKCKKMSKQQILEAERSERRRKIREKAKWTRDFAKKMFASAESYRLGRYIAFKEAWAKGDIYENSDTSDEEAVARVCESPEKASTSEDGKAIANLISRTAKRRFFPRSKSSALQERYEVLAPDTMDINTIANGRKCCLNPGITNVQSLTTNFLY